MISRPLQITIFLLLVGVLAGGIYMNRLKQREQSREQGAATAVMPLSPPVVAAPEDVELMIAYDDDGVLKKEPAKLALSQQPNTRAKQVLRALISRYAQKPSPHPLAENADVKEVFMTKDGLCVVDLNAAFADAHRSGVMIEEMTIASLVESLAMNVRAVRSVKFLVEGGERETLAGHVDLSMVYDVDAVHRLTAGMQAQ